jgi:hypothetical protein
MSSIFVAFNVAAAAQSLTVRFDAALYGCQFCLTEFDNLVGVDATSGSITSGTNTISPGALTSTAASDLIYQYGFDTSNAFLTSTLTGLTPGTNFTFLSADTMLGTFAQYSVQSAAGSITPQVNVSGETDNFNTIAVAFKSGAQGAAAPPGIRIVGVHHVDYYHPGSIIIPSSGNLLYVATAFGPVNVTVTGISSSPANTWVELPDGNPRGNNGPPQCFYTANAATSPTLALTIRGAFGISSQISFVIYDIAGASANPYDSSWTDNGNYFSANSGKFSFGSITPSTPNGLVIATVATYEGVLFASAQTLDSVTYGGEVDADLMDNADGYAHYYNPNTSPVTFSWTLGAAAASVELPQVVAFKAAGH